MKKLLLGAMGAMLFASLASATTVTSYSTAGSELFCGGVSLSLNCSGSGTSQLTFTSGGDTVTLTYNSNSDTNVDAFFLGSAANTSWGSLTPNITGVNSQNFDLTGVQLQLFITASTAGGSDPNQVMFGVANVTGQVGQTIGNPTSTGSNASYVFTSPFLQSLTGTVTPAIQTTVTNLVYGISFTNPTTIQGTILAPDAVIIGTTPEPSSLLMMGSALIGLGALKFRKRS